MPDTKAEILTKLSLSMDRMKKVQSAATEGVGFRGDDEPEETRLVDNILPVVPFTVNK